MKSTKRTPTQWRNKWFDELQNDGQTAFMKIRNDILSNGPGEPNAVAAVRMLELKLAQHPELRNRLRELMLADIAGEIAASSPAAEELKLKLAALQEQLANRSEILETVRQRDELQEHVNLLMSKQHELLNRKHDLEKMSTPLAEKNS